jgi:hypothetical protein
LGSSPFFVRSFVLLSSTLVLFYASVAFAATVTLEFVWQPSQSGVAGYRLYCCQESESCDYSEVWEGPETACSYEFDAAANTTYCFVVRAFDAAGNESSDSNQECWLLVSWDDLRGLDTSGDSGVKTSDGGGCFIATAAFGSYVEPHVKVLRDFRNQRLLTNTPGRWFVRIYYRYSPFWADIINTHSWSKPLVRLALMPAVGLGYVLTSHNCATYPTSPSP